MMQEDMHRYDELFYRYQREGSLRSARAVLPQLRRILPFASVLDVGCGAGAWLAVHRELGAEDIQGLDGDYVDRSLLLFDVKKFQAQNIVSRFDLDRRFDLVQCLEVAEHVPSATSPDLVDNLVRHGAIVLFSAAVPGQGGEDHINEQDYGFWRDLFAKRGYRLFDCVRPLIAGKTDVEPWYRYNMMLFAHDDILSELPGSVLSTRIPDDQPVPDWSPIGYRLRRLLVRQLSPAFVTRLSIWNYRRRVAARRSSV